MLRQGRARMLGQGEMSLSPPSEIGYQALRATGASKVLNVRAADPKVKVMAKLENMKYPLKVY